MAGGLFREYNAYFGQATEVWKRHVIGVTIEAFDEYRDSVCQTLENVALDSSRSVPDGSADGQAVNSQEDMFGNVQNVLENAQHLAQQRIADTLAQTFNALPPILLSPISNQTIQVNPSGESAISQGDVNSGQNDDDSLDVSIKSEVDSSSESECESDTDDEEVQVKEEPNEEENIIPGLGENYDDTEASFHEQTENTDNSGDQRENSNESANEQQESNVAMAIDEELAEEGNIEEDPNGPIIIEVQYTSPPSSPLNAEANDSSAGQQDVSIALNEDITRDEENAEEDYGDFGEDEQMDDNDYQHNLENQESDLDGQDESDHEGGIIDEETDGEDSDSSEEQEDMSEVEDNEQEDSGDETNNDDDDYNEPEEEEASLGVAGPSTSGLGRQGIRRVAKRQMVSGKAKRQRTGRNVEAIPLSVITKKLKCTVPGCKKVVKSKRSMNRHLLSKHQLKKYRCLVRRCHGKVSTSFATQSQLNDHRDQVHGSTTRWTCKCSKKFKSYQELSNHYWRYHELGLFTCSKDGCTFKPASTRVKVQSHLRNHGEAKHVCTVDGCGKSFKKKDNLDKHTLTHTEDRPISCPECAKSFKLKHHLTAHLRIHQNDKCFRCTWLQCTYSSNDRSAVTQHIRIVHFKLPRTKKKQLAAGIIDDRDARDFLAKN